MVTSLPMARKWVVVDSRVSLTVMDRVSGYLEPELGAWVVGGAVGGVGAAVGGGTGAGVATGCGVTGVVSGTPTGGVVAGLGWVIAGAGVATGTTIGDFGAEGDAVAEGDAGAVATDGAAESPDRSGSGALVERGGVEVGVMTCCDETATSFT